MGKRRIKKDFDSLIEEAIDNIREDRSQTSNLLFDLMNYISGDADRHKEVSLAMAKYVETLQRSNEQLVKITSLVQKDRSANSELTEAELDNIFDELNEGNGS